MIEERKKEDVVKCINGELYYLGDYVIFLYEELERYQLILKALHKYFQEHEEYESNEFLRQLESCNNENDIKWLKKMAGDEE